MTDLELVARARDGDTDAFGDLVERHRVAVYRAARAAVGSPEEADEVTQDAFVSAFGRLAQFRGDASVRTWLLAIAWRAALTRRRRLVRWARLGLAHSWPASRAPGDRAAWNDLASWQADAAPSPEEEVAAREIAGLVGRLVRALPGRLRDPLLLVGSGEYTYDEIAAMLGVPVGTVKWRVADARRHLRERLTRLGLVDD